MDLRERVIEAYETGEHTQVEVAELFGVGEASVRRWVRRKRERGTVAPTVDYTRGPAPKIDIVRLEILERILGENRDATNEELADIFCEQTGVSVSPSSISRAIALLGWTRKKSPSLPPKPTPRVSAVFVKRGPTGSAP
jgi:transposase